MELHQEDSRNGALGPRVVIRHATRRYPDRRFTFELRGTRLARSSTGVQGNDLLALARQADEQSSAASGSRRGVRSLRI